MNPCIVYRASFYFRPSKSLRLSLLATMVGLCACGKIPDNAWPKLTSDHSNESAGAEPFPSDATHDSSGASSDSPPGKSSAITAGHIEEEIPNDISPPPDDETDEEAGETGDLSDDPSTTPEDSSTTSFDSTQGDTNESGDHTSGSKNTKKLTHLSIQPSNAILQADLNESAIQQFSARGFYSDGSSRDLSEQVHWKIDQPALGSFVASRLQLSPSTSTRIHSFQITAALDSDEHVLGSARLTVANYRKSGPDPELLFILPYRDPHGAQRRSIRFQTALHHLDVFFAMDTTASMGGEIDQLQKSLNKEIIPQIRRLIPNSQFGLGAMQDFPLHSYGAPGDQPFRLLQNIGPDLQSIQKAVDALTLGNGYDHPEAIIEALYQIASGDGLTSPSPTYIAENRVGKGGVGFRPFSLPVIVPITDAISHAPGENRCPNVDYTGQTEFHAHSREQSIDAMRSICAKVISIASSQQSKGSCSARADGEQFAQATQSRVHPASWDRLPRPKHCPPGQCCTGVDGKGRHPDEEGMCPLVFDIDPSGDGLGQSIVAGLQALVEFAPFDVVTKIQGTKSSNTGNPLPFDLSSADFVKNIVASHLDQVPLPGLPLPRRNGENIEGVFPGMTVEFSLTAYNDIVEATSEPQVYRAKINVYADRCTQVSVDEWNIIIVVPPRLPIPQ